MAWWDVKKEYFDPIEKITKTKTKIGDAENKVKRKKTIKKKPKKSKEIKEDNKEEEEDGTDLQVDELP